MINDLMTLTLPLCKSYFILILLPLLSILFNADAQEVKALTFNIRLNTEADGPNRWDLRKESVVKFLKHEHPDFIGLQEVLVEQLEYIEEEMPEYKRIGVARDDGKKLGEFSPIFFLSREWELLDSGTFWLSQTPNIPSKSWDAALPRICTWGKFRRNSTNQIIYVLNTHFDHVGKEARKEAASIIAKKIGEFPSGEDVILMGDFNAEPDAEPIQLLLNSGLNDAWNSKRNGQQGTFNGFNPKMTANRRIDYVFYSGSLKPLNYSVPDHRVDGRFISDHFPVIVDFQTK